MLRYYARMYFKYLVPGHEEHLQLWVSAQGAEGDLPHLVVAQVQQPLQNNDKKFPTHCGTINTFSYLSAGSESMTKLTSFSLSSLLCDSLSSSTSGVSLKASEWKARTRLRLRSTERRRGRR